MLRKTAIQVDAGLDIIGLVNHSFYEYEVMASTATSYFDDARGPSRTSSKMLEEHPTFFNAGPNKMDACEAPVDAGDDD